MKRKKTPLTLIEVLLTFGLTAILSTFLITSLIQYMRHSRDIEKAEKIVFTRAHLEQRLMPLLYPMKDQQKLSFYTKENILYFQFDNGIDPDKTFSGTVEAELFLKKPTSSKKKFDLCLKITGSGKGPLVREEILLTGVKSMQFQFYSSQKADKTMEKKTKWEEEEGRPMFFVLKIIPFKEGADKIHFPFYLRKEDKGLTFLCM